MVCARTLKPIIAQQTHFATNAREMKFHNVDGTEKTLQHKNKIGSWISSHIITSTATIWSSTFRGDHIKSPIFSVWTQSSWICSSFSSGWPVSKWADLIHIRGVIRSFLFGGKISVFNRISKWNKKAPHHAFSSKWSHHSRRIKLEPLWLFINDDDGKYTKVHIPQIIAANFQRKLYFCTQVRACVFAR